MSEPEKLWNWKYIVFVGMQTLSFTLFYMMFPVIPKYTLSVGNTLSTAGILSGAFAISSLVFRPVAGYCIDHFNRKYIMLSTLVVCGASTIALLFSGNWIVLLILRLIYGAGCSFFSTMLLSCAADYIPERNMAEGIGYFGLGVAIAAAIGPAVGIALSERIGMRKLFVLVGLIYVACAAIMLFVPVKKNNVKLLNEPLLPSNIIEKKVIIFAILVMPFSFSNGFVNSFIALTAEERHISGISLFFTVFAVIMLVLKPLSGKLQDKWGLAFVLIPSFIFAAMGAGLISIAQTLIIMLIAAVLLAFGQGAGQPALLATCVKSVDLDRRGIAISTYYIGLDLGIGIGAVFGSRVASALGYGRAYLMCSFLLLMGLLIYMMYYYFHKGEK